MDDLPLADNVHGINGMVPPEGLHTFGNGVYETLLDTVHDIIGPNNKHQKWKERLDKLHMKTVQAMK